MPDENKVLLSNGREYTYKALVISPGLDHRTDMIEGLDELNALPESENFFVHKLDQATVEANF
jgi:NADH dehydrogenase FAD-containing subunit